MKTLYKAALFVILINCTVNIFAQQTEREMAIELYQKGDYQNAAESLQKVVEVDEKDREAWLFLGMAYARLDKKKLAVKSFKTADKVPQEKSEKNNKDRLCLKSRVFHRLLRQV